MAFSSWQAFWHMGGYADFVWPAYLIVLVIFVTTWFIYKKKLKQQLKVNNASEA